MVSEVRRPNAPPGTAELGATQACRPGAAPSAFRLDPGTISKQNRSGRELRVQRDHTALLGRLGAFIDRPETGSFDQLALEVFAFQFERVEPFRRLAEARGLRPQELADWRQIPPVPVAAFKSLELAAAPARVIFRSSGTTAAARSVHHHPFPGLYRRVAERLFRRHCLFEGEERLPLLSLIAARRSVADSSLGFMVEHLLARHGERRSRVAMGADRLDFAAADAWAEELVREGSPGLIFATAFALAWWLEHLEERGIRHALPAGSRVFETGGFKGRVRELRRPDLLERIRHGLGVPGERVVREYGMSELTGHFYTRVLQGADPDLFSVPHFMRVRALDPESLREVPRGQPGLLAILDLANAGSAMHVLSEDVGVIEGGGNGFRLVGRAGDAELRGCSLTVDELRA